MRFAKMDKCRRSEAEQRIIWAMLEGWDRLPQERRMELRGLVDAVAVDAQEARALWESLRGRAAERVSERTGVPVRRIYDLRCRFYERVEIR